MKQFVIAGTLAGALAVGGTALAQQPPAPTPKTTPPPAGGKARRHAAAEDARPRARTPRPAMPRRRRSRRPPRRPTPPAPRWRSARVRLPKGVKADGKEIAGRHLPGAFDGRRSETRRQGQQRSARAVGGVRARAARSRDARSSRSSRPTESQARPEGHPARVGRLEGRDAQGWRLRAASGSTGAANYYLVHFAKV